MFHSSVHNDASFFTTTFLFLATFILLVSSSKAQYFPLDKDFEKSLIDTRRPSDNNVYRIPEIGKTQLSYPLIILAIIYPTIQSQQEIDGQSLGNGVPFGSMLRPRFPARRRNPVYKEPNTLNSGFLSSNGQDAEYAVIPTGRPTTPRPRRTCPPRETFDKRRMKCVLLTSASRKQ